jgi:hypothetical protein
LSMLFYFLVGSELSLNPSYIVDYNLVCAAEGFKFDVWINPFGGYSTCYGNPENLLVYSIIGPVFGAMAAGAPLAISKIRHSKTWQIVLLLAPLANEAIKIPIEALV